MVKGVPASEAESCQCSGEVMQATYDLSVAKVQGLLKGSQSFWMLNAQISILPHSRDFFLSFLTSTSTTKTFNVYYLRNDMLSKVRLENCK